MDMQLPYLMCCQDLLLGTSYKLQFIPLERRYRFPAYQIMHLMLHTLQTFFSIGNAIIYLYTVLL